MSEAEHPLLCESTRKQRGELAIAMLVHYKDDQVKLSKVGNLLYCICHNYLDTLTHNHTSKN